MKYLYGDSTPSPLQSNFLAFLRDAMGFCVHLLQAQEQIATLRADAKACDQAAEAERTRIGALRTLVLDAAGAGPTDGSESASHRAFERVRSAVEKEIATTLGEVASKLASDHAAIAGKERAARDGCLAALGELLGGHQLHDGGWKLSVELGESGYAGKHATTTPFGIAWTCALAFGSGHPMAAPMKVGDAVPQLELSLPEAGGLFKKGKVRPQRVDQYSIDAVVTDGRETRITLRVTPRTPVGLDIVISDAAVQVSRAGGKDREVECEVSKDDAQKLIALRDKLIESLTVGDGLKRRTIAATIDDKPLADTPDLGAVAQRVIAAAAPITNEIQAHSLSPYELVIRRLLGNDRREEIFVTSASLLDKLSPLSPEQREVFNPLNLKRVRARTPIPGEISETETEQEIVQRRIRLVTPVAFPVVAPPSEPPPEVTAPPPPAPTEPESSAPESSAPESPAPTEPAPPAPEPTTPAARMSSPAIDFESASKAAGTSEPVVIDAHNKEALAATVKRIVAEARAGRTLEAYEAYAALFEDPDFAQQRPQDQRQVLKLMVMAKSPPPNTPMVLEAYRSALSRLKSLSTETGDPVDAEMTTVCQGLLDRPPSS